MSIGQTAPFGGSPFQTNGVDVQITGKSYPAVTLSGTETGASTSSIIEIAGATWVTSNAMYSPVFGGFQQVNALVGSSAMVIYPTGVQLATAPANATFPIVWTFSSISQFTTIRAVSFDTVGGFGANNPLTAVCARFPLPLNFVPTLVTVVGTGVTTGCLFNISLNEVAMTAATASAATATSGNSFFTPSASAAMPASGVVGQFAPTGVLSVYPSGSELTLRVLTPAGGGIASIKVTIAGYMY